MFKDIYYFIFIVFFISCSKNNDNVIIKEEIPVDNTPKIGVKYFGPETNSFDEGVGIFEVSDGYVSIEQLNIDYSNGLSEGFTNISFRKLNSDLETTIEKIHETNTHDYLVGVVQANDSFIILENQTNEDKSVKETYIKILSNQGEVLNSKQLIALQGSEAVISSLSYLYFENNTIYASYRISTSPSITALIALDMQLNILWERTFSNTRESGGIQLDIESGNIYYIAKTSDLTGSFATPVLNVVDSSNGNLINSYSYPSTELLYFNVYDVALNGDFLYLAGETVFENKNGLNGAVMKINKLTGEQESIAYWETYGAIFNIEVKDDNLFLNLWDDKLIETSIVKTDNSTSEIWNYTIRGNARNLLLKENGEIVFTGRANKPGATDNTTDIFIGILDQDGKLK